MSSQKELRKAIKSGSLEGVQRALEAGVDTLFVAGDGSTPLGLTVDTEGITETEDLKTREAILEMLVKKQALFASAKEKISDAKNRAQSNLQRAASAADKQDEVITLESMISILDRATDNLEKDESLAFFEKNLFSEKFSDVRFTCSDGNVVYAHKIILVERCPSYFEAPLSERWEDHDDSPGIMKEFKPEATEPVMKAVLAFIYTGKADRTVVFLQREDVTYEAILTAADEYHALGLVRHLEKLLMEQLTVSTLKTTLVLAHRHELKDLETSCFDMWRQNWSDIMFQPEHRPLRCIETENDALWQKIGAAVRRPQNRQQETE